MPVLEHSKIFEQCSCAQDYNQHADENHERFDRYALARPRTDWSGQYAAQSEAKNYRPIGEAKCDNKSN